jgi:DNA gyrase subunit B
MEKENRSALGVVLTVVHAGGKFDKGSYKVSGGLHGVGVSCVNALSVNFRAEVRRDGKLYAQDYQRGKPVNNVSVVGTSDITGTTITFKPDAEIFSVLEYKYDVLAGDLRDWHT